MPCRWILILPLLIWSATTQAASVTDATGRVVDIPATVTRVLPAGPPAAVLMEALAPDLMVGWPGPLSMEARPLLPGVAADLDPVPRLTGREDVIGNVTALKPDLILDYGAVTPRYADLMRTVQQQTGIPAILLDGSLQDIPKVLRLMGTILQRQGRAETLAAYAEALLSLPNRTGRHPTVVYARGTDGLNVAAAGTDVTAVFTQLGWRVLAPDGTGTFRPTTLPAIAALDPDVVIFNDPAMRETLATAPAWRALRAVREGHAVVAPGLPFGWIEDPPSINRLIGLAWLAGHDPEPLAAAFNAVMYGKVLSAKERDVVRANTPAP